MSTLRLTKQTPTKCIASFVRRKKAVRRQKEVSNVSSFTTGADVTLDGHGASVSMGDVAGDNHQCCRSDVLTDTILLRRKLWDRSASTRKTRTG